MKRGGDSEWHCWEREDWRVFQGALGPSALWPTRGTACCGLDSSRTDAPQKMKYTDRHKSQALGRRATVRATGDRREDPGTAKDASCREASDPSAVLPTTSSLRGSKGTVGACRTRATHVLESQSDLGTQVPTGNPCGRHVFLEDALSPIKQVLRRWGALKTNGSGVPKRDDEDGMAGRDSHQCTLCHAARQRREGEEGLKGGMDCDTAPQGQDRRGQDNRVRLVPVVVR